MLFIEKVHADAVSRLNHIDEVAYINTKEDLRDDMNL